MAEESTPPVKIEKHYVDPNQDVNAFIEVCLNVYSLHHQGEIEVNGRHIFWGVKHVDINGTKVVFEEPPDELGPIVPLPDDEPEPEPTDELTVPSVLRAYVNVTSRTLNVRSSPEITSGFPNNRIGSIPNGSPVFILQLLDDWAKIKIDNDQYPFGYVWRGGLVIEGVNNGT